MTHFLDIRLVKLASKNNCYYSRYADDITFSTNKKEFPSALAVAAGSDWILGKELQSRIVDSGFVVNDKKTRMQLRGSRQVVTGLTVNQKVNVQQKYYKTARAMAHAFITNGSYNVNGEISTSINRLDGIINHVYHIRERLIDLSIQSEPNKEKQHQLHSERVKKKNEFPSSIRLVYRRLVFFKHFIDPSMPLIVCEGPTDEIYLKCAIRKLAAAHPKLASISGGKAALDVQFFNYSNQVRDLLQLNGGSSDLKFLLEGWKSDVEKYKYKPMKHPVIILIDNDDGAIQILKLISGKKFGSKKVELASDEPFFHLDGHLYLVKTPIKGGRQQVMHRRLF